MNEILTPEIQQAIQSIIFSGIAIMIFVGIYLGLTKKAVFYANYNDLLLSLAVFAIPLLTLFMLNLIGGFLPNFIQQGLVFVPMLILMYILIKRTYISNNNSAALTVTLVSGKLILSFLFLIHLYSSIAGQKSRERRFAAFILVILTPLMLALVHDRTDGTNPLKGRRFGFW